MFRLTCGGWIQAQSRNTPGSVDNSEIMVVIPSLDEPNAETVYIFLRCLRLDFPPGGQQLALLGWLCQTLLTNSGLQMNRRGDSSSSAAHEGVTFAVSDWYTSFFDNKRNPQPWILA